MLNYYDLQTKCFRYWPEMKQKTCYEDFAVQFEEELVLSKSTIRIFKLTV